MACPEWILLLDRNCVCITKSTKTVSCNWSSTAVSVEVFSLEILFAEWLVLSFLKVLVTSVLEKVLFTLLVTAITLLLPSQSDKRGQHLNVNEGVWHSPPLKWSLHHIARNCLRQFTAWCLFSLEYFRLLILWLLNPKVLSEIKLHYEHF